MAMPISWLRASMSLGWPRPPRSCSSKSKPVDVPSSITGGGAKANTTASRRRLKTPMAFCTTASTLSPGLSRWSQSFSLTKAMPVFWPIPAMP